MSSAEPEAGLDGLLDRLEAVIGRLSDPVAPLERLVADYEEAGRLVEAAQGQLDHATKLLASVEPATGAGAGEGPDPSAPRRPRLPD